MTKRDARTVLITGASKGIGRACAIRMHARGWRVYAGVRTTEDADALRAARSERLIPLHLDVTSASDIAAAAHRVAEDGDTLSGLVNNAGIVLAGPLEFLPIDALRRQLEVNVAGAVAMTQPLLPMLRRGRGRIVFIGSVAGRSAVPITGAYCASKFAVEAIADVLRVELGPWGIEVSVVEPGVILTRIWETSLAAAERMLEKAPPAAIELYGHRMDGVRRLVQSPRGLPAEAVADVVEHALVARRPRTRYVVGRDARLRILVELLPDRLRDALIGWRLDHL